MMVLAGAAGEPLKFPKPTRPQPVSRKMVARRRVLARFRLSTYAKSVNLRSKGEQTIGPLATDVTV
jgi:hypothetical protein